MFSSGIPISVALAAVATIGYLVGRRGRQSRSDANERARRDVERARTVARDLLRISSSVRAQLERHEAAIARFKERASALRGTAESRAWDELFNQAQDILAPTQDLAAQMAYAYDQIRHQTHRLAALTEARTDPLTEVHNRRAMEEVLQSLAAMKARYGTTFSLVLLDVDHFKRLNDREGHLVGDEVLQRFSKLLVQQARETDVVARYGGDEFVVVMPNTESSAASSFAERVQHAAREALPVTVSIGVASARDNDDAAAVLRRADQALYHAKTTGRDRIQQAAPMIAPEPKSADDMPLAVSA